MRRVGRERERVNGLLQERLRRGRCERKTRRQCERVDQLRQLCRWRRGHARAGWERWRRWQPVRATPSPHKHDGDGWEHSAPPWSASGGVRRDPESSRRPRGECRSRSEWRRAGRVARARAGSLFNCSDSDSVSNPCSRLGPSTTLPNSLHHTPIHPLPAPPASAPSPSPAPHLQLSHSDYTIHVFTF